MTAGAVQLRPGPLPRTAALVLARPDRGNAIDAAFTADLLAAARAATRRAAVDDLDCLLVTAEGTAFCVGGDLRDFPDDPETATPYLHAMSVRSHEALALLHELPVPVVGRVQGVAAGAGIGLAAVADIVLASTTARFVAGYPAVALPPDCGTSWLLPRLIGERRTLDLLLTNRAVDAAEAQRWGLVTRAVPPEDLDAAVDATLRAVLAGGPAAAQTKRLVRASRHNGLRSHLADEGTTIATLAAGEAAIRARTAFVARRRSDRTEAS